MKEAAMCMGISAQEFKASQDSFGGMQGMVDELKGVKNRTVMDSLFLSFFSIVSVSRSEQAVQVLLGIYSKFGYTEDDCLKILQKAEALSKMFMK